jgi:putative transposase
MEVMADHIHLFLSVKPTIAPADIVRILKSISAIEVFRRYPRLKCFYNRCGSLWSKGYFVSTVGKISAETVKKYIEEQKTREKGATKWQLSESVSQRLKRKNQSKEYVACFLLL